MRCVLALLAALFLWTGPALAQTAFFWTKKTKEEPSYKQLLLYDKQAKAPEEVIAHTAQIIRQTQDANELHSVIIFSQDKAFLAPAGGLHPDYFLIYSDALSMLARVEASTAGTDSHHLASYGAGALEGLMYFEIIAMEDAMRCRNPEAWQIYKKQVIVPRIRQLAYAYASITPEEYRKTIDAAIAFSVKHKARAENKKICASGMPQEGDIFTAPLEWHQRRAAVPETLREFWTDRYKQAIAVMQKQQEQKQQQAQQPAQDGVTP